MYIIHFGTSGFPYGNAAIQRIMLTFRSLKNGGLNPLIINKNSTHEFEAKKVNKYEGLPYVNTSYKPYRPGNFIQRRLNNFTGFIGEFIFIFKKRKEIDTAIFYDSKFLPFLYYCLLSKLFGFKFIFQYVELRSSIPERQSLKYKLNDILFEKYCTSLSDGVIVISELLKNKIMEKNSSFPCIKLPSITDFSAFKREPFLGEEDYMMYCGTIEYLPVIDFVIALFEKTRQTNVYGGKLMLIIGGNNVDNFDILESNINDSVYKNHIILRKNLRHNELIPIYLSAYLLLIPLRKTLQDEARLPHKLSEYTASKRPILTTNIGDIPCYFMHGKSAILADEYTIESYYKAISTFLPNKVLLNEIGDEGYKSGLKYFNFESYSSSLKEFISK